MRIDEQLALTDDFSLQLLQVSRVSQGRILQLKVMQVLRQGFRERVEDGLYRLKPCYPEEKEERRARRRRRSVRRYRGRRGGIHHPYIGAKSTPAATTATSTTTRSSYKGVGRSRASSG